MMDKDYSWIGHLVDQKWSTWHTIGQAIRDHQIIQKFAAQFCRPNALALQPKWVKNGWNVEMQKKISTERAAAAETQRQLYFKLEILETSVGKWVNPPWLLAHVRTKTWEFYGYSSSGWWFLATPSWKIWVRQLGWWQQPNISGKMPNSWQPVTTKQSSYGFYHRFCSIPFHSIPTVRWSTL